MNVLLRLLVVALCGIAAPAQAQVQDELRGLFNVFVRESNARNVAAVGQLLLDSREFAWVAPKTPDIQGRDAALQFLTTAFKGVWRIEPDPKTLTITSLTADSARLQVAVRHAAGAPDSQPQTEAALLTQTYVKTALGWRIAKIALAPTAP